MMTHRSPPVRVTPKAADVTLHWVDAVIPTPSPAPSPPPRPVLATSPRHTKKTDAAPASTAVGVGAPTEAPALPSEVTDSPFAAAAAPATPGSVSKWAPSLGVVLKLPGASEEQSHGTTVRNDPTERPDPVALGEYEGEQLSRKLNNDLSQDLARAMAGAGNVPPFFKRVEKSMREKIDASKVRRKDQSAGDLARDVAAIMAPSMNMNSANTVADSPLGRSIAAGVGTGSSAEDQRFRESALQSMAWSQTIVDRVSAPRLRTVLEFTQDSRGVLAEVTVVEKSGDPVFDESVMHYSRKVVRDLPDSDDQGLGTKWWRSRWQFTWEPPNVRVKLMEAYPFSPPVQ
jgi:hypothetical protein